MAEVSLKNVRKVFGKVEIIHGLSAEIADGSFTVVVGPSGCGKSTVLRLIAGLERISGGEIAIGDQVVNNLEPKDRDVAMVFQNYALYPHMSVFDNLGYGLKVRRFPKAEIRARVLQAAEVLGLTEFLKRRPRELSGGQRQRVAMGRAIVREPRVFLFDEPLSNLDAKLRTDMRAELKRLHQRLKVTSIYVTHDQVEAMTLADVIMILNAGRIEQMGSPDEVYHRPESLFVARFIGSPAMNVLPGRIESRTLAMEAGPRFPLSGQEIKEGPILVGLRPEHLTLAEGGEAGGFIHIQAELLEPLGADLLVHGALDSHKDAIIARLPGETRLSQGQTAGLNFKPAHLHLFDPQTGLRLKVQAEPA